MIPTLPTLREVSAVCLRFHPASSYSSSVRARSPAVSARRSALAAASSSCPFSMSCSGSRSTSPQVSGLMTVVATSSVVARRASGGLVNLRLGMVLQIAAAAGGYFGGSYARRVPEHLLQLMFSVVTGTIAAIMLSRLDQRNVILDRSVEPNRFGGCFFEGESRSGDRLPHEASARRPCRLARCGQHLGTASDSAAASCRFRR